MSEVASRLRTSDFDYPLDENLIAQRPLDDRDAARLLVVRRDEDRTEHLGVRDLIHLIPPGDILVLNETRVFPARLLGVKPTGAEVEVLLVRPLDPERRRWYALVRPGGKLKPGRVVEVADELRVVIEDSAEAGGRIVRLDTSLPIDEAIDRYGHTPLPPYIRRDDDAADRERYQTVYAREQGSVAAPTAGLHFSRELLDGLERRGVLIARVTLHVGPGTFRPVAAEDPSDHELDAERYRVSPEAADAINRVRQGGGSIWAVGTTVVRVLETLTDADRRTQPGQGWTDLFILPGHRFRAVDHLLTNFHLPRSTLLMLVAAFAGRRRTLRAYEQAMEAGYRFYSYGDAMLVI